MLESKLQKITYKKGVKTMIAKPVKNDVPKNNAPKGNKQSAGQTKQKRSGKPMFGTQGFPRNY